MSAINLPETCGYSSDVRLWLECEFGKVRLTQTGSKFVVPAAPLNIPECNAQIVVSVDGHEFRRAVYLANGASDKHSIIKVIDQAPF